MSKVNTREDLVRWTHRKLGMPVVKTADLHPDMLDDIIDESLTRFYEQAIGFAQEERILYLPVTKGQAEYDISGLDRIPTSVREVTSDNLSSVNWKNFNRLFTIENLVVNRFAFNFRSPDLLTFQTINLWLDFFGTMYGKQYRAEINEKRQTLYMLPFPEANGSVLFLVWVKRPEEEILNYSWVREYVFAKSLIQIGMNRSKFSGINLPGGGNLNGDMYLSKGEEMVSRLEEQLLNEWSEPPDFEVA